MNGLSIGNTEVERWKGRGTVKGISECANSLDDPTTMVIRTFNHQVRLITHYHDKQKSGTHLQQILLNLWGHQ